MRRAWQHTALHSLVICSLLLLTIGSGTRPRSTPPVERPLPTADFRIVGYLPEYRVMTVDPVVASTVSDLIFFSLEPTPDGGIDSHRLTPPIEARLRTIQKNNPQLRRLVAFGGADRSNGFAPMATDPARRRRFITALGPFCRAHGFAGVDYDWEFPKTAAESRALASLVVETKRALAPLGLTVSIAVAPWDDFPAPVLAAVDALHFMTYFDDKQRAPLMHAVQETEALLRKGAARKKVMMGVPFYGEQRDSSDVTPTYGEIAKRYHPAPETDTVDGVAFNGPATIRQKTRYAFRHRLGGIMIWELGQDTRDGVLLRAIRAEIDAP